MSNYFIKAILLEACPYSISTNNLLKTHKLPSNIIWIKHEEKEKFKTEQINTFPQIYLCKINTKGNLLLGGHDDFNQFIDTFKKKTLKENNIINFMKKYDWSRKSTLRFIQLVN
jgi:glutaredoxin